MDPKYSDFAKSYKKKVAGSFMLVDGGRIQERVTGEDFLVTRKLDGTMQIVFYNAGEVFAVSSSGEQTADLPCLDEFAALAKAAGLESITVAAELYAVINASGRERVGDVSTALAKQKEALHLAPFDIIDINGTAFEVPHYKEKHAKLMELFPGKLVSPVEGKSVSSSQEVQEVFDEWVTEGGAEGLVVHCNLPFIYKIKARHTLDGVVIGYSLNEDDETRISNVLLGFVDEQGCIVHSTTLHTGISEELSRELFVTLSSMHAKSEYIDTDSRNVAYQMVRPEIVMEYSVLDIISENSKGEARINPRLKYSEDEGYVIYSQAPGVSTYSPVFVRIRDDKSFNPVDVRFSQVTDICPLSKGKTISFAALPKSEMLFHRIYTKGEGAKLMIQKYIVWKTNKEESGMFPAYVFHYTDFSCGRKEPLKREIRVSSSREQIMQLLENAIAENVKKGWSEYAK